MALVQLGGGITDIRGSIGGTTFARNAGGNYIRARMKPVNPRAPTQEARRAAVAELTTLWSKTLTDAGRTSWRVYATGTTWTNRLGQTININGLAAFVRTNTLNVLLGRTYQFTAPAQSGQSGAIAFTASASFAAGVISIDSIALPWDNDVDVDTAIFHMSLPRNPGVESAHTGFKYLFAVTGDNAAPPAPPYTVAGAYILIVGQKFALTSRHFDELGRVSAQTRVPVTIVA